MNARAVVENHSKARSHGLGSTSKSSRIPGGPLDWGYIPSPVVYGWAERNLEKITEINDGGDFMSHSIRELYNHLVWATKNREPLINNGNKEILSKLISEKAWTLGCEIFAFNCVCDHVHLLLYIPPSLAVSMAINGLKGYSSHELEKYSPDFSWQRGYSIFTLRRKELPIIEAYIKNQEQHHHDNTFDPS